jgi:hypothetical protein
VYAGKHIDNKSDAEALADKIRGEIREGTFGKPAPRKETTLAHLFDTYLERYVRVERASREAAFLTARNTICRTEIARPSGGVIAFGECSSPTSSPIRSSDSERRDAGREPAPSA